MSFRMEGATPATLRYLSEAIVAVASLPDGSREGITSSGKRHRSKGLSILAFRAPASALSNA
jgi:hypothetical protein